MFDGGDVEGVAVVVEAHPIIADAKSELWRIDVLKALYVSLAVAARSARA